MEIMLSWLYVGLLVGLLYSPITIGLGWSFRYLNYPDLTCEGSFVFAGSASILILNQTNNIALSIAIRVLSGFFAGLFTSVLHLRFNVSKLLSGVITWSVLYSISIHILGGVSNRVAEKKTIFEYVNDSPALELLITLIFIVLASFFYLLVAYSKWGRLIRSLGDQYNYPTSLGYSPQLLTAIGLGFSNALIGFGASLLVHFRGIIDVNMGSGLLIGGLASLVLGETTFNVSNKWQHMVLLIFGAIMYNLAIGAFYFNWGVNIDDLFLPSDVRMMGGLLILASAWILSKRKGRYKLFASDW